jgi:hypothetical protein
MNTFIVSLAIFSTLAGAAPTAAKQPPKAATAVTTAAATAVPNKLLWDAWYTITISKTVHYSYFSERFEIKDGKLFYQSKSWKQEEGYLNEEQLGSLAEYTTDLTPLFFNFHSTYRTTETVIDGNVRDHQLTVKIRKANTDLPLVKKNFPSKTIFSALFPVWLGFRLPVTKPGATISFLTVMEDNLETGFGTVSGQARIEPPDAFSTSSKTTRVSVNYKDLRATWYVERNGMPVRIEIPAQKAVVEKVGENDAKAFLEE